MSETVLQLTYLSACAPHLAFGEVERILDSARLANRQNDLTGLLLFNGQHFLQHLEGPAEAVDATFARIREDSRHRGVILLHRTEAEFRAYSRWSLAFEWLEPQSADRHAVQAAQVAAMVEGADPRLGNHFLGQSRMARRHAA